MGHLGALGGLPGPSWKPSCASRTPWRAPGRRLATPEALGRGGGARAWMPPEGGPSRMTKTLPDSTRHSTAPQRARGHGGVPAGDANGVCLRARSCPRSTFHQTSRSNGECSCDFLGFFRFGDTSSPEVAPLLIDLCGCGCAERRAFSLWAAPWPRQVRKTRKSGHALAWYLAVSLLSGGSGGNGDEETKMLLCGHSDGWGPLVSSET